MIPLSTDVKDLLVEDRGNGMTYADLSKKYNISISGARKICEKYKSIGSNESFKHLSGRKRSTSKLDDDNIVNKAKRNPTVACRILKEDLNLSVSTRTVQRRIHEIGMQSFVAKKKTLLRAVNIKKRLLFAKKYLNMPETFWDRIIWTDEAKFELKSEKRRKRVWCEPLEKMKPKNPLTIVIHGTGRIMVWGCFSTAAVGRLVKIDCKMTGKDYVNILSKNIDESARKMQLREFILQQYNDPTHTSAAAKQYFEKKSMEVMEWPPQSPDLNPIEDLWPILDTKIPLESRTNIQDFWEAMQREWEQIPHNVLKNLVRSMPKRLKAVIENKGRAPDY